MPFFPFSKRAKAWEMIAIDLRTLAGVDANEIPVPEIFADKVGLQLMDARIVLGNFSAADQDHLLSVASGSWSGGVYPRALPNGRFVCILNPTHSRRRNRITLMEEVVHIHRGHKASGLRDVMPGLRLRDYHVVEEAEAYGVGAAVLLPWPQFYGALNVGTAISDIAEAFDVTEALVQYRIKITGASNLYRSRCQTSLIKRLNVPAGSTDVDDRFRSWPA